jgi:hypothetical protein
MIILSARRQAELQRLVVLVGDLAGKGLVTLTSVIERKVNTTEISLI